MKALLLLLPLLVTGIAMAGSLGKYQVEVMETQPRQKFIIKTPDALSPSITATAAKNKKNPGGEFYQKFSLRVSTLSGTEKQTWLSNYKGALENAFNETPVNTGKIRHYTQLVDILQRAQGG